MDEPTNGMDIPSKAQFRRLVSMVFSPEKLLLISTHQVKDLENMIDRVIIVDEGKLLLHHSLGDIVSRLCFTSIARMPEDDSDILYAEPSLQGIAVVIPNSEGLDSKINLEQLFQAVTAKPDMIQSIFSDKTIPYVRPLPSAPLFATDEKNAAGKTFSVLWIYRRDARDPVHLLFRLSFAGQPVV